jgi:hypothetical protein
MYELKSLAAVGLEKKKKNPRRQHGAELPDEEQIDSQ